MSNQSLFDQFKTDAIACDNNFGHYLAQTHQRAALTCLTLFEQTISEVSWRVRPPKVNLRGVPKLLDMLKGDRKLKKFVRVKEEINKDAILADPKAVQDIKGISISSGVEDFVIKPFEVETGE